MATRAPSRYRALKRLARGGVAEIWEAMATGDGGFERRVALKRLLREHVKRPSSVRAFVDEARILSQLHHANIVAVYDFGVEDGVPFQALELVDGIDLATALEKSGGRVPAGVALKLVAELARALAYAHRAKDAQNRPMHVVHRDVTPENILLSWKGEVKLTDFGIARAEARLEETEIGVAKGKLEYMPPEQLRGEVDGRADIYALGCVLHLLLTGKGPTVKRKALVPVEIGLQAGLPPRLQAVIERATRLEVERRYSTADEMAAELEAEAARAGHERDLASWLAELGRAQRPAAHPLGALFDLGALKEDGPTDAQGLELETHQIAEGLAQRLVVPEPMTEPLPNLEGLGSPTPPAPGSTDTLIGRVIHGYRLLETIGRGGAGRVYRARHLHLPREYAVKVLSRELSREERQVKRFQREAKTLAGLTHPNVVSVIDFGSLEDGRPFFTMELLPGRSLKRLILEEGPLAPTRAARIARDVARGLGAAHARGVIHRDMKPSNVMVVGASAEERALILDFGCTRAVDPPDGQTKLTQAGSFLGTAAYTAPEQAVDPSNVGPAADVYGVGAVIYAMLTKRAPYQGPLFDVLREKQSAMPEPPPHAEGLGPLAMRLLSIRPQDRPPDMAAVVRELEALFRPPEEQAAAPNESQTVTTIDPSLWEDDDEREDQPELTPLITVTPIVAPVVVTFTPGPGLTPGFTPVSAEVRSPTPWIAALGVLLFLAFIIFAAAIRPYLRRTPPAATPVEAPEPARVVPSPGVTAKPEPVPEDSPPPVELRAPPRPSPRKSQGQPGTKEQLRAVEQRARRILRASPLSEEDLLELPAVAEARSELAARLAAQDLDAAEEGLRRLESRVAQAATEPAGLKRRLERVARGLADAVGRVPEAERSALEGRYLDLRRRYSRLPEAERGAFSRELAELEARISP